MRCNVKLYATGSPATPSLSIGKQEGRAALKSFATGESNLLIITVVAEEGMDVPEANCVIRYDPVLKAVSFLQGRGRARASESNFVVMKETSGKSASVLHNAEELQISIAIDFFKTFDDVEERMKREALAKEGQKNRERGVREILDNFHGGEEKSVVSTLNLYCKKTKVEIEEKLDGAGRCVLTYRSTLRIVEAAGEGKRVAACALLMRLKSGESGI